MSLWLAYLYSLNEPGLWALLHMKSIFVQKAVLSQGGPRDAAVNFGTPIRIEVTAASRGFHCSLQ